MIYLQLFWSFIKVGFTSFGGLSMVPLISSEMLSHGWMTAQEVADIIAIAEMTPGPLGMNCATFAGTRAAGFLGAVAANMGVLVPTFTLTLTAAILFHKFKNSKFMQSILTGVRPAALALVIGVSVTMLTTNYVKDGQILIPSLVIGALDLVLLLKYKFTIPKVIFLSAGLGLVIYGLLPMLI